MSATVDVNLLLQQMASMKSELDSLKQQAKAREASVYISRNGNLTLTWRKQGVQRSFLIPSKRQDGSTWLRGGGVPATYTLGNGVIDIHTQLAVDADESKLFSERFIQQVVVAPSSPGRQAQAQQTTQAPAQPITYVPPAPVVQVTSPVPVTVAPATPAVDMDAIVAEAQSIMGTMGYKSLDEAVKAVKKARGIK